VTRASDGKTDYPIYTMGGQLLTEDDQRANTRTDYVSLNGSLVAKRVATLGTSTWTTTYEHTDALHSPNAETNAAGTATRIEHYTPYGEPGDGKYVQGPGYTGHVTDAATGLTYAQQRYYDPVVGRFLSVDPVLPNDNGGSFNRYWYANNNPYKFTDPDGRCTATKNSMLCSAINFVRQALGMENYTTQNGVVLTRSLQNHISDTADYYHAKTNKKLVVTSGVRTAGAQAKAMEFKITHGEGLKLYRNKAAAQEIMAAYQDAINGGTSQSGAANAMAVTISSQMAHGVFISDHLSGMAADFQRKTMNSAEQESFRQSAREAGASKVLTEGVPVHFHAEFAGGD